MHGRALLFQASTHAAHWVQVSQGETCRAISDAISTTKALRLLTAICLKPSSAKLRCRAARCQQGAPAHHA